MPRSFEEERTNVGEGWLPLVDELHANINAIVGEHQILQIKEKFGGLRYYYTLFKVDSDRSEQVRHLVSVAEEASFKICEECGQPGEPFTLGGWVTTRCIEHRQAAIDRRKQVWEEGS